MDVAARGAKSKASKAPVAYGDARREEIRLAWANAVPWVLRGRMELPLATRAVLGMTIARAQFTHSEWRAEVSLTEMQRRLGGTGCKTVVGAVCRLERAGIVRAIRKRRNRRFSEVNVYVLEHPEAMRAASETLWSEEELPHASGILLESRMHSPAPPGAPETASKASRAPEAGEGRKASPEGSRAASKEPSRAPRESPSLPRRAKTATPVEGPRAAPGVGETRVPGSSPGFNSSPKETHKYQKEDFYYRTTEVPPVPRETIRPSPAQARTAKPDTDAA